jgi:ATP-dependent DNA helicase Rep
LRLASPALEKPTRRYVLDSLNAPQREAVLYTRGPLLVLAGAGSGKTRVISAKIAHLVGQDVAPARIAAITFTNKAAREMRERVDALLRKRGQASAAADVAISTFHALGLRLVRSEARLVGRRPGFSVLDPSDLEPIVAELVATADRGRARDAQQRISRWKNALVSPEAAIAQAKGDDELRAARAYAGYAEALAAYHAVDFDDLIALPVSLLERDAEARARWQARFAHVLVDEYQDTNPAQYRMLRALVGDSPFTVVGDDDQAIYGWRGATLDNLAALSRDYPELAVIKLEQNYRSTVRILRSANALIGNNAKLHAKRLFSELGHGEPLQVFPAGDDTAEAELVAARLLAHKFERRTRFADYAVLYRGNHQARALEAVFRTHNIPYEISGGSSWFDRSEVKDLLAYLRLMQNESDDPAFVRAITTPPRGVGRATLARLLDLAGTRGGSRFKALSAPEVAALPAKPREALVAFRDSIERLRGRARQEAAERVLNELVATIGYDEWLTSTLSRRDAEMRNRSVREFVRWLAQKAEADRRNLLEIAQQIALLAIVEGEDGEGGDAVRLATLHAAKGLEFPHVFIVGVEEGILPHREAIDAGNVEEERRLFYVGITRAGQSLHLSYCRARKRAGERRECTPSRFIAELAQDDVRYADSPATATDAEQAKRAGNERLKHLKTLVAR